LRLLKASKNFVCKVVNALQNAWLPQPGSSYVRTKSGVRLEVFDNGFRVDLNDPETIRHLKNTIRKIDKAFYIKNGQLHSRTTDKPVEID
jgi:hypothetical protein